MTELAIAVDPALLAYQAAGTLVRSAAIDVGFEAVLAMIRALIRDAHARRVVARMTRAVPVDIAVLSDRARRARGTSAVRIGLVLVFPMVCTRIAHAPQRHRVAGAGLAIDVGQALQADRTRRTDSATVHVSADTVAAGMRSHSALQPARAIRRAQAFDAIAVAVAQATWD